MDLVGRNITNAGAAGYARRRALLEASRVGGASAGGVTFAGASRAVDRFAAARLVAETGRFGAANARAQALSGLDAVVAPTSGGIADRLGALFDAATSLATDADDPTARLTFVARAQDVAAGFRSAGEALAVRRSELVQRATDVAGEVNSRLADVAKLNARIAEGRGLGQDTGGLEDSRDMLVREIGERVPLQTVEEPSGALTLLSGGTSLVTGDRASSFGVELDAVGGLALTVTNPAGGRTDVTSRIDSGSLAGIREARDVDLARVQTSLDTLAVDVTAALNAIHSGGVGLDGVGGRPLFGPPVPGMGAARGMQVDPAIAADPSKVAASQSSAELPGGNATALALAALRETALPGGGTVASRAGGVGATLGMAMSSAEREVTLRTDTLTMADNLDQQARGVSLEEEMVDLTRYQRAFEASMKVLKVADELLEGLIREM